MELAAIIISAFSLVCSVVAVVINYKQNQKITSLNMQSRYYEKIFDEYLITEIPKSRNYMKYINDSLTDADKLIDTLDKMKKDSLFFKYNNERFYNRLTLAIDELTNILTNYSNTGEPDQDRQCQNIETIKTKVSEIYKMISDYSNGVN